jgi:hemerythrin
MDSERLKREHQRIADRLGDLRNSVASSDPAAITAAWTEFERALEAHLADEEQLLVRLERRHPEEVHKIRGEHALIHRLVGELGIRADLRTLRQDVAEALLTALEAHVKREEHGLYAWADDELEPDHKPSLLDALYRRAGGGL